MLLKNGMVYDGTLNKAYKGSIFIENNLIKKIYKENDVIDVKDEKIIDCDGLSISPGFIDAHSHNDFFAARENNLPYFDPFVRQGVTSMIVGNCGFSAAGYSVNSSYNDLIGGGLFSNNGKDFSDFGKWGKLIDHKIPVNLVSLVGHGSVRIGINGKGSQELNPDQLKELENVIEKALKEGAAGVSFGLMYEPGQFAPFEELEHVARIVKRHNKILTFHARACSKVSTSYNPPVGGRAHNLRAMDEVIRILKKTGVKTEYSHLIFVGKSSWNTVSESLEILENAKKDGYDIMFDMYPMEFGASIITVILPTWYLGVSKEKKAKLFTKIRLSLEIFMAKKALGFGFEDILITNTFGQLLEVEGMRVSEVAKLWKKSQFKTYLKLVELTNGKTNVLMYKYQNKEIIEKLRKHPQALYMTDAWTEKEANIQNFACYYTFPKFIILARDHKTSIEEAIHKMTRATAKHFNIEKRGTIEEGCYADLTIFNLEKLSFVEGIAESPIGINYVINNGVLVFENGNINETELMKVGRYISIN